MDNYFEIKAQSALPFPQGMGWFDDTVVESIKRTITLQQEGYAKGAKDMLKEIETIYLQYLTNQYSPELEETAGEVLTERLFELFIHLKEEED